MDIYGDYNFDDYKLSDNTSDDVLIESDRPSDTESDFMIKGFTPHIDDKKRKFPISDKASALVDPDDVEECDEEYEPWVQSYVKNMFTTQKRKKHKKHKKGKKSRKKIKSEKSKSNKSNEKKKSTKDRDLVVENAVLRTELAHAQDNKRALLQGIFLGTLFMAKDYADTEKITNIFKLISNDAQIMTNEPYMIDDRGDKNEI